jgi:translation initiation factor IF-2
MNVPTRPTEVKPVGPRLEQPLRTKLAGPKIIRVEQPEVMPERRPGGGPKRPPGMVGRGGPRVGRGAGFIPEDAAGPPGRPIRGGGATAGARPGDATRSRRNKRRSAATSEEAGRPSRAAFAGGEQGNWREQDLREREERLNRSGGFFKAHRRDTARKPSGGGHRAQTAAQAGGAVKIQAPISILDLSSETGIRTSDILKRLLLAGHMVTRNSVLSGEQAREVMAEFNIDLEVVEEQSAEQQIVEQFKQRDMIDEQSRPPVVTILGHVDHGKTSLLDKIRNTNVAAGEAGGITQATSAFQVPVHAGDKERLVTFLDTPGHEAFTMMRARGARVTDVVVLVVAADDGVMPQTREAIDHARAANVPIIVAINKIDKADANPERVKRELSDLGLMPESWGGSTVTVEVSARQRKNLDQLLEMILLVADLADLKANPKRMAQGTVLEAKLDRGRGPVATVLVQDGTLNEGDLFIAGTVDGKVRALFDHLGHKVKRVGPAMPAEVLGLSSLPQPGDTFQVIDDPIKARQVVAYRQAQAKEKALFGKGTRLTLESLQQQMAEGGVKELPIIIKADVQGSAEVLADTLAKLSDDRVKVRTIHTGVGAINESDVLLATASNAIIIGFNVRPDRNAAAVAEREKVDIRLHSIIYQVTDEMKKAMTGLLAPTLKEARLGIAEVRQTFKTPKVGTIAGCFVTEGRIARSGDAQARLVRDNVVVWHGKLSSLRRFKDDVSEVKAGLECGVTLERFNDVKVGDVIEAFTVEKIEQTV